MYAGSPSTRGSAGGKCLCSACSFRVFPRSVCPCSLDWRPLHSAALFRPAAALCASVCPCSVPPPRRFLFQPRLPFTLFLESCSFRGLAGIRPRTSTRKLRCLEIRTARRPRKLDTEAAFVSPRMLFYERATRKRQRTPNVLHTAMFSRVNVLG